jgi:hypothetical protein
MNITQLYIKHYYKNVPTEIQPSLPSAVASTSEKFLEELKQQYLKEFEVTTNLDSKANNIITISGTIATFLFGFGLFMIEKLNSQYQLITILTSLLAVSISAIIISIILSLISFPKGRYRYAMRHTAFYNSERFNEENIKKYKNAPTDIFYDTMIRAYLRCNKHNMEINIRKAQLIGMSLNFFMIGILTVPVIIGILLSSFPTIFPSVPK